MHPQRIAHIVLSGCLLAASAAHAGSHGDGDGAPMASVEMLTGACVACHGPSGNSTGPATPSLAGLPAVYFVGAMLSYAHGADVDAAQAAADADPALEDVEVFARGGTIMNRIAPGYTLTEIKTMAAYFEGMPMAAALQEFDDDRADRGEELHADNCEKCHEDGGRSTEDDMVPLAGQWKPYLHYALADFHGGVRGMPKKMKSRLQDVAESGGMESLGDLIHYYASQQ